MGVPIARTGSQAYADGEVPVAVGANGIVQIERPATEVFDAATIASFEGKPVTMAHPDEFVTCDNWETLSYGHTQNVRRGTGILDDCLVADLVITRRIAIDAIQRDGLREVSCGYDAAYEATGPGAGIQREIRGNHVALVERGRCGPRCAIGDKEKTDMTTRTLWDRMTTAFQSKDEAAFTRALGEARDKAEETETEEKARKDKEASAKTGDAITAAVTAALAPVMERMNAIDAKLKTSDSKPDDQKDDESDDDYAARKKKQEKTGDAMPTRTAWQDVMARAEILSPGLRFPAYDAKGTPQSVHDAMCGCKRRALDSAYHTDAGKAAITPFLAGAAPTFDKMPCSTLDTVFLGASELIRAGNNAAGARTTATVKDFGPTVTPAALNQANTAFWARK